MSSPIQVKCFQGRAKDIEKESNAWLIEVGEINILHVVQSSNVHLGAYDLLTFVYQIVKKRP